ncbi:uncharacterized protein LOC130657853 [Hydractinia symbiolongicarpus]|uniref:uncharacterized protein LOC130657853 n=1 Tax=Hydractinia symbiolongicarpus TaxID=13093 RepID=UPI00254CE3AF|nr:uncharacterized protein LOC130657853 [Hydractinia symbiolongicarpus]
MLRKGVYPYKHMDGWQRFEELELPPKEAFYSKLSMNEISDEDYQYAKEVWNVITPKVDNVTMGYYHDIYLTIGVCLDNYKLDPAHFYSAPGLAWKAALKFTGIRASQRSQHAPDVREGYKRRPYDPDEESSYLQYLDANNPYGWAMRQDLPTDGFKCVSNVEAFTERRFIRKLVEDSKDGYILEIDIDYPEELHKKHNELPFLPGRKKVHKVEKLIPNLEIKCKYVVHIRALYEAINHGLEFKKVHRVIRFNQKAWLAGYIDHNTRLRTNARNEFEKDFYKLMNLLVFGKTMENIRNHRNIQLVTNEEKYMKLVMKPNFKGGSRSSKNLLGVEMGKTEVKMKKPIYIWQVILDMSKLIMYEFHYDYMQPKYGSKLQLSYMDTDSFVYDIRTEDFYRDIAQDVEARFDTSAYNADDNRPFPIGENKKVVGLMKDELGGKIMTELITLRAELYAYKSLTKEGGVRKAKGVKRYVTEKSINFDEYKQCILKEDNDIYKSHSKQGS